MQYLFSVLELGYYIKLGKSHRWKQIFPHLFLLAAASHDPPPKKKTLLGLGDSHRLKAIVGQEEEGKWGKIAFLLLVFT